MSIVFSTARRPTQPIQKIADASRQENHSEQSNDSKEQKHDDAERESNHARISKPKSSARQDKGKAKVIGYV